MLGVVESGVEGVRYRGETVYAPAGNLMMVNPGEVHTGFSASGTWTYRGLYPTVAAIQELAREIGHHNQLPFFLGATVTDSSAAAQFLSMHKTLEGGASSLERESLLTESLVQIFLRHADHRPPDSVYRREHRAVKMVKELLADQVADNVNLRQLAHAAGLSRFHLIRVFKREMGLSPHQYQSVLRVQRARRLLLDGRSIVDAAMESGFCDQSHLLRHFKLVFGVTPGSYASAAMASSSLRDLAPTPAEYG